MAGEDGLVSLAAEAGLELRYWDIAGRLHEASGETLRALLLALGFPCATEAEISESRRVLTSEPWASVLPPILIAREHQPIEIPFRLPFADTVRAVRCSVAIENGERHGGECVLESIPVEEIGYRRGEAVARRRLRLDPLPLGYHALALEAADLSAAQIVVAPERRYCPETFAGRRLWWLSAQLYALKSDRKLGIGDFGDLRRLIEASGSCGADAVGLSPLHALFLDAPDQASPYSPCSRLFRNPLTWTFRLSRSLRHAPRQAPFWMGISSPSLQPH